MGASKKDGDLPVLAFPKRSSVPLGKFIRMETADPPIPFEVSDHMVTVFPCPRVLEASVIGRKTSRLGGISLMQSGCSLMGAALT